MTVIQTVVGGVGGDSEETVDMTNVTLIALSGMALTQGMFVMGITATGTVENHVPGYKVLTKNYVPGSVYYYPSGSNYYKKTLSTSEINTIVTNIKNKIPNLEDGVYRVYMTLQRIIPTGTSSSLGTSGPYLTLNVSGGNYTGSLNGNEVYYGASSVSVQMGPIYKII